MTFKLRKFVLRKFLFCFFISLSFLSISSLPAIESPHIRVALLVHASRIQVSSREGLVVHLLNGQVVFQGESVVFRGDSRGLFVNDSRVNVDTVVVRSRAPFSMNKRSYRGSLRINWHDDFLDAINEVDLEKYLYSVVGSEMLHGWPVEALKAQAVIARTYALKKRQEHQALPFDVVSTVQDQEYDGIIAEDTLTRAASDITQGEILTYQGDLITAYYHSDCGGKTERGENVFPGKFPYLQSVECPYGKDSPYQHWTKSYSFAELSTLIGSRVKQLTLRVDPETEHVSQVVVETVDGRGSVPGFLFRKALGSRNIRSTHFELKESDKVVYVPRNEGASFKSGAIPVIQSIDKPITVPLGPNPKVYVLYHSGALSEGVFSQQNPFISISGGGVLAPLYKDLAALSLRTDFVTKSMTTPPLADRAQAESLGWAPLRVPFAVTFLGRGWGHGVGLCQWGAHGMALLGKKYTEILHYYYQNVELKKIY